jgi:hypothetical protein
MSEDGVRKSSNPLVSMTAGSIAGGIECVTGQFEPEAMFMIYQAYRRISIP